MSLTVNPCPFCGHDDVEIDEVSIAEYAVDCPECRAIGPITSTVMESITRWNAASKFNPLPGAFPS